eukprot:TRINITY_DN11906_c0_g1_i1.p1 TRINITY_DN11906_c0_g1~~TRINITY_DN11906_c0_g1_i1.p1  ORF type:complete len:120 (+),score=11.19 TRINITY_DN11906_c0_g1_i1:21-380(+)
MISNIMIRDDFVDVLICNGLFVSFFVRLKACWSDIWPFWWDGGTESTSQMNHYHAVQVSESKMASVIEGNCTTHLRMSLDAVDVIKQVIRKTSLIPSYCFEFEVCRFHETHGSSASTGN